MKRAVIQVRAHASATDTLDAMGKSFIRAWNSDEATDPLATITFSSPTQLFSVISPKRWELIERLQTLGPSSIRGLARALERDVKRVHDDIAVLIEWGVVDKTDRGQVRVPFDIIHADFDLKAVA